MHIQYSIAFRLLYGLFRQGHVWTQFHGAREQVPQVQPTNEQPFNGFQWVKARWFTMICHMKDGFRKLWSITRGRYTRNSLLG